jgi:hypothetical protein
MKISEYIGILQAIAAEHGDLEVDTLGGFGERRPAAPPRLAYRLILNGRQSKPRFWSSYADHEDYKGQPVCRCGG